MKRKAFILLIVLFFQQAFLICYADGIDELKEQFTDMPMESRRLTGPLFWLHGTESKERLEEYIEKIVEGGNGSFCAESRPHNDWLGEGWYRDLEICLNSAKKHNLKMWIFDEKWWPSQTIGGKVPVKYAAKVLDTESVRVKGPNDFSRDGYGGENFIAALAGKVTNRTIEANSIIDLSGYISGGKLKWAVPAGKWKIMKFTYKPAKPAVQSGDLTLDGASIDCVDWFIKTVYQPHYDRFKDDFGKTIVGYFYDEPETQGDWGTEMAKVFAERNIDWKKAFVAYKYNLAGEEQIAAKYAYIDTFFETWGKTMYGTMTDWCGRRNVESIGHFMDHRSGEVMLYLHHGLGAGNMMQVQKYSSMGGVDLVIDQLYPNQRTGDYQLAKLAGSISHVYNKKDHRAMCEIFGGYGQTLCYMDMKWLTDHHQLRGVNFLITHGFNPKAPADTDYPPYFYNGGFEPRWPLYRIWADYNNSLNVMLTGGKHVCDVALLFCGNSKYVGKAVLPEEMTSALQDCLYDVDWLPYEVFENDTEVKSKQLCLYDERYRILIVPPVEVIPFETIEKAYQFFENGGVVIGYDFLPSKSATMGKSSKQVQQIAEKIWGVKPKAGFNVKRVSKANGRSYFLPGTFTTDKLQKLLALDAKITPALQLLESSAEIKIVGPPDKPDWKWLHVLHRVKNGCDIFFICNQYIEGGVRLLKFRAEAEGIPQCWDPMRNEICSIPFKRISQSCVEFELAMEPYESVLIVFDNSDSPTKPPLRIDGVTNLHPAHKLQFNYRPFNIPAELNISEYRVYVEVDDLYKPTAAVIVNGQDAGGFLGEPMRVEVSNLIHNGTNRIRFVPKRPKQAHLVFYKK